MTPSATSIPTQTTKARAEAFMYILKRGWLTQKQIEMAMEFGFAAARNGAEVGGGEAPRGSGSESISATADLSDVRRFGRCIHCEQGIARSPAGSWFHREPWRRMCVGRRTLAKPKQEGK